MSARPAGGTGRPSSPRRPGGGSPPPGGEGKGLEIIALTYETSGRTILDGLSAAMPQGSITALLGPNGAGKTTLLRCLSGEIEASSGEVHFDGGPVALASDEWKTAIGVVPDSDAVFEELTVREQLSLAATLFGVGDGELSRRVESLLELAALADREEALGSELSAGMRKRLSVALALVHAPRILLLDEPLNALDYASSETFFALLQFLRSAGRTVLISGHALPSLLRVADRVLEIEKGRTVNSFDLPAGERSAERVLPMLKTTVSGSGTRSAFGEALAWLRE